jgi:hypothetical protein
MIEQEAVNRADFALREECLEPCPIEPPRAFLAEIFTRKENHCAIIGKKFGHIIGAVEIDIIAIGPVKTADCVYVLQRTDLLLKRGEALFNITHHRLSSFCM